MAFPTDSDLNAARKHIGGQRKEEMDNFQIIKKKFNDSLIFILYGLVFCLRVLDPLELQTVKS